MTVDFNPDIFHGELTAHRAQVFVRVPRTAETEGCALAGYVHGPFCEYAQTLPAKFTLQDLGPGPTHLARATITDPCLWTSDLPQLYHVHVELRRDGQTLAKEQRLLGLRGIGAKNSPNGGRLMREGKVWVPRGCTIALPAPDQLQALREQLLVGVYESLPPLDLLAEASRRGLYLMVKLTAGQTDIASSLAQLARWPAVALAAISGGEDLSRDLMQAAPNLLLAQPVLADQLLNYQPAPWAQAALISLAAEQAVPSVNVASLSMPLIWELTSFTESDNSNPRQHCDRLQSQLTSLGQFAGYFVGRRS